MKTIKLNELGTFKNGLNFTNSEIHNPCKILGVADFKDNVFPPYSDLKNVESEIVPEDSLLQENDILFVRSNGNKNLVGRMLFIKDIKEKITFSGFCIRFRPISRILSAEYIFYMLKSDFCKKQYSYSQQTNITNLSQDVLGNVKIPIIESCFNNINFLLNVDEAIDTNNKIMENLDAYASVLMNKSIEKKYEESLYDCKIGDLVTFETGKEYANFANDSGKYRYFTCSQDVLWCNEYAFDGEAIIVATHGDFHVDYYIGKFNAYFCNSVLMPHKKMYFGLIYYSISKYIPKLKKQASGSVIKFISNEDLSNLQVIIPNNEILETLNTILKQKQILINQNIHYSEIKQQISHLLLNGQATFKD